MKTFIIKYIFYIVSITDTPSSQVLILQEDSVTYWDYDSYVTKKILYRKSNLLVVKEGWILITNTKVKINSFRRRETLKYKIRYIVDQNKKVLKDKSNPLY